MYLNYVVHTNHGLKNIFKTIRDETAVELITDTSAKPMFIKNLEARMKDGKIASWNITDNLPAVPAWYRLTAMVYEAESALGIGRDPYDFEKFTILSSERPETLDEFNQNVDISSTMAMEAYDSIEWYDESAKDFVTTLIAMCINFIKTVKLKSGNRLESNFAPCLYKAISHPDKESLSEGIYCYCKNEDTDAPKMVAKVIFTYEWKFYTEE